MGNDRARRFIVRDCRRGLSLPVDVALRSRQFVLAVCSALAARLVALPYFLSHQTHNLHIF